VRAQNDRIVQQIFFCLVVRLETDSVEVCCEMREKRERKREREKEKEKEERQQKKKERRKEEIYNIYT